MMETEMKMQLHFESLIVSKDTKLSYAINMKIEIIVYNIQTATINELTTVQFI